MVGARIFKACLSTVSAFSRRSSSIVKDSSALDVCCLDWAEYKKGIRAPRNLLWGKTSVKSSRHHIPPLNSLARNNKISPWLVCSTYSKIMINRIWGYSYSIVTLIFYLDPKWWSKNTTTLLEIKILITLQW